MNKEWSDAGFMSDRGPAYFAIYIRSQDDGQLTPVAGTLMQLPYNAHPQTLYWYFKHLQAGTDFEDYKICEVDITDGEPAVNEEGMVTNWNELETSPVAEGDEVSITGRQKGETESSEFTYSVSYEQGSTTADSNVRVDTVTNERPGIVIKKAEWNGTDPLAGAVFTLTDNDGNRIGTFTSREDGLIARAFLRDGVEYTLTETDSPQGWYGLQEPMKITLNGRTISVDSDNDPAYYTIDNDTEDNEDPVLTVKDRPYTFEVIKMNGDDDDPMAGVVFDLHRQVTVGDVTTIDLNPMPGYKGLTTDENGLVPKIDNTLPPGTYELRADFYQATLKTRTDAAGHIRMNHVLMFLIRLLKDKEFRKLLAHVRRKGKEGLKGRSAKKRKRK